jgi:hypothetical protein
MVFPLYSRLFSFGRTKFGRAQFAAFAKLAKLAA